MTNPDQAYYWTEEWQQGEQKVKEEIEVGLGKTFDSAEDAIAWLEEDGV